MDTKKKAVVMGAGGFIGGHLVTELKKQGYWVRGVDLKRHQFKESDADEFIIADLRSLKLVTLVLDDTIDEVYQLAADMGGALFIFTGENDADIMRNSALINLNVCNTCVKYNIKKIFYSSSACVYPEHNQLDPDNPNCSEDSAYPAAPDSEYGWEKLFSERLYLSFARNKGLNVKIARFHNIFGPYGTYKGGREKAPAAMIRKVCEAKDGDEIEVWGDGLQTRSFLYIDECIEGVMRLMNSKEFHGPVNIGSDEMVSINRLAGIAIELSGKRLSIKNKDVKQVGVRGRNSDNTLIEKSLGWRPNIPLIEGMRKTYQWINSHYFKSISKDPQLLKTRQLMNKHHDDMFYKYPGINNSKYFYTTEDFPKLQLLEREVNIIREELKTVINQFEKPGILFPVESLQECWKNFWLLSGDRWNPDNIKKCPETYKLLKKIDVKREALFAMLKPDSEISPHKGTGNHVIRCQLPLLNIPNNSSSGIQCGPNPYEGEKRYHYTDKLIIFDDSNWHGAWNKSNLDRIVLIFDIRHPSLNEDQYQECCQIMSKKMEEVSKIINKDLPETTRKTLESNIKN